MNIIQQERSPSVDGWGQGELGQVERALAQAIEMEEHGLPERLARCTEPGQREAHVRPWANKVQVLRLVRRMQMALEERHGVVADPRDFLFLEGARGLVPDGMLE